MQRMRCRLRAAMLLTGAVVRVGVVLLAGAVLLGGLGLMPAVQAADLAEQVHAYTLDNGMRVLMVVRDHAPIIHFNLMFDAGGVDEPPGLGGIAHMVEHMAFKGTGSVGSLDPEEEARRLAELEEAADAFFAVRKAHAAGELQAEALQEAEAAFHAAREHAQEVAEPDALREILDEHGGTGHNARTGYDFTDYVVSLPANRLELWTRLYADVLRDAVFRFFYEEVDVVMEERRQVMEDDPRGFLSENFLMTAYEKHPYGRPLIGTREEIRGYRTEAAWEFWENHYHPNRAVLVMVGDLDPEADMAVIERYFGTLAPGPQVRWDIPEEPPQTAERRGVFTYDAEPRLMVGWHKPTYPERDAYVMDVVSALLGTGRTARLYRRMIVADRLALDISTSASYPGTRAPNLLVFNGLPRSPHTPADLEKALYEEVEQLQTELVSPWELEKVQNQVRAGFLRLLASAQGLASQLAFYEHFLGGWERILDYGDIVASVTAEEVRAAAREYLVPENRVVAVLLPEGEREGGDMP